LKAYEEIEDVDRLQLLQKQRSETKTQLPLTDELSALIFDLSDAYNPILKDIQV
jgi:hypothetical protein